jgi:hypothetical protein
MTGLCPPRLSYTDEPCAGADRPGASLPATAGPIGGDLDTQGRAKVSGYRAWGLEARAQIEAVGGEEKRYRQADAAK